MKSTITEREQKQQTLSARLSGETSTDTWYVLDCIYLRFGYICDGGSVSQVTSHRSRVAGYGFMSTSTPVMWSLSLQQGIFRVYSIYLVLDRRLCRHVAIVGARSRVRVASKLLVFGGEINTIGHTVKCLA
jgi:hypothetical protein